MKTPRKLLLPLLFALTLTFICPNVLPVAENISFVEAASKVKLNKTKASLIKGQTLQLKITGSSSKVKWTSSRKSVATVSSKGKITAKGRGSATITAKLGKKKYTCKITVETPKISKTSSKLIKNETLQMKLSGTKQKITWKTSRKSVATVSTKGKITAKGRGTATITATVNKKNYTCKITVEAPSINKTVITLEPNKTFNLRISGTTRKVIWSSSNKAIATVSTNGTVTTKAEGSATISAAIGNNRYACKITVKSKLGSREKPLSAYASYTTDIYDYRTNLGKFNIQLLDYKDGNDALNYVMQGSYYPALGPNEEYIYLKFKIDYISGETEVKATDVISTYSNLFNSSANYKLDSINWAFGFENVDDMGDVSLYPGGSAICSMAIIVRSGNTPITYRLETGYDEENYQPTYTWFTTK